MVLLYNTNIAQNRVRVNGGQMSETGTPHPCVSVRPDIFAPRFYSMFGVILAVAPRNAIPVTHAGTSGATQTAPGRTWPCYFTANSTEAPSSALAQ